MALFNKMFSSQKRLSDKKLERMPIPSDKSLKVLFWRLMWEDKHEAKIHLLTLLWYYETWDSSNPLSQSWWELCHEMDLLLFTQIWFDTEPSILPCKVETCCSGDWICHLMEFKTQFPARRDIKRIENNKWSNNFEHTVIIILCKNDGRLLVVVPDKYSLTRITGYNNTRMSITRTQLICKHSASSSPSSTKHHHQKT